MRGVLYALVAFAVVFAGGLVGLFLGRLLPDKYQSDATQRIVQTSAGMVSLITALVLGLLVANVKGKFDTTNQTTEALAAQLMLINRRLVKFGPEADAARELLRKYTIARIAATWPGEAGAKPGPSNPLPWKLLESLQQSLSGLAPQTEAQRSEAAAASEAATDLEKTTWLQVAQAAQHIQQPFVGILILWLFVLFVSLGLFAPRNGLVVAALLVAALAIGSTVLLIVDMDSPYEGGMAFVSPQSTQLALAQMSHSCAGNGCESRHASSR
jgi:hypothetical protein